MKQLIYLLFILPSFVLAQNIKLEGEAHITVISKNNGSDSLVVTDGGGKLGWKELSSLINSLHHIGDLKQSLFPSDHDGWYALDGRDINTLPAPAKQAAIDLGFVANLPDMSGRMLKHQEQGEFLGQLSGSNEINLTVENLPSYNLPLATTSQNTHSHNVSGVAHRAGGHRHWYNDKYYRDTGFDPDFATPEGDQVGIVRDELARIHEEGSHEHTISGTAENESHDHSVLVNSGGSGTPVVLEPSNMVTLAYVFLGQ
ncbi:hypothetical protein [Portibacter marinus]|uniref:hypothetical protein n=1 Tax=Portibacter marinus TaxID=2898660 RepID=UPI001F16959B|nr:hypothetical protein [Portibacter marinus]